MPVLILEGCEFFRSFGKPLAARLLLLFKPAVIDVVLEVRITALDSDALIFSFAVFDSAEGGEILGILCDFNQFLRIDIFGTFGVALFPAFRYIVFPCFDHSPDISIGSSEQKHMRSQSISACQDGKILADDGLEE